VTRLAYCISGHGYGHARRSARIIEHLLDLRPDVRVHILTTAPVWLFDRLPRGRVALEPRSLDVGVVEQNTLTIDVPATVAAVGTWAARASEVVGSMADHLRSLGVAGVIADAPDLAGPAARAAGVPAVMVANFTWDWICEPLLAGRPGESAVLGLLRRAHGDFEALLRLPFGGVGEGFPQSIHTPLVACTPRLPSQRVLELLPDLARRPGPRIVLGMRQGCPAEVVAAAARQMSDVTLVLLGAAPHSEQGPPLPANVVRVDLGSALDFADLLAVSDGVVSKLGYGILADCCAAGVGLIWPPRRGFREDEVAAREAGALIPLVPLSLAAFEQGDWVPAVRQLLARPRPRPVPADGADFCARWVAQRWDRGA
jgi:hypothetical protein